MMPISDPQAVRNPRPDLGYYQSGLNGLQTDETTGVSTSQTGVPMGGSRVIQWGYNPVGGSSSFDAALTPNYLVGTSALGSVTVSIT
jgi:hypothetical protein